jgi:hypothetical protein
LELHLLYKKCTYSSCPGQRPNSERIDPRFDAYRPIFVKKLRDMGVYKIDLKCEICQPVSKLDYGPRIIEYNLILDRP